jgi:hypothetical protein
MTSAVWPPASNVSTGAPLASACDVTVKQANNKTLMNSLSVRRGGWMIAILGNKKADPEGSAPWILFKRIN